MEQPLTTRKGHGGASPTAYPDNATALDSGPWIMTVDRWSDYSNGPGDLSIDPVLLEREGIFPERVPSERIFPDCAIFKGAGTLWTIVPCSYA